MKTRDPRELLVAAQHTLRLSHEEFGALLGSSKRTAERWGGGKSFPVPAQLEQLARHVHEKDATLAQEIAASLGKSLHELGLAAQPTAAMHMVMPMSRLVDSVVCAAAEVMDVSPRAMRPALHAALQRAREMGLSLEAIEGALAPEPQPPKGK